MERENSCIVFLKKYRAHPEKYLPLTEEQYRHFDEWEEEIVRNMCWGAGLLEGNRTYFMECWKIFGMTTCTVTVYAEDLEPKEAVMLLLDCCLVQFVDPGKAKFNIKRVTEGSGNVFYGMNMVVSNEGDDWAEQYLFWNGPTCRFDELNALNED